MMAGALANIVIQVGMAALRYFLQIFAFKHVAIETVGEISLLLTFITSTTFVAGLELHNHLNRPILLGEHPNVRGIGFRAAFGATTLLILSLTFATIAGVNVDAAVMPLIFATAVLEYANLELGRLLIIHEKYLLVTGSGAARALAPFIPALFWVINPALALGSWSVVSLLSAAILFIALRRSGLVHRSREPLTRADFSTASRFFLVGGVTAALPFVERLFISRLFGLDMLGVYALIIIFVGMGDMLMQGVIWQPFLRRIVQRLANPAQWRQTAIALLGATLFIYGAMFLGLLLFAPPVFKLLNKALPPTTLIGAVFLYGAARSAFTICFQLYYANHAERLLPYLQTGIAGSVLLSYYVVASLGGGLATALAAAALGWALFPAAALAFRLPHQLHRQAA